MDQSIWFLLLLQVFLIALNAVFACAEIAVLSINETKLERMAEQGNRKAKRLFRMTREPAKFLATIQVAITLSGFLGSAFAADNFSEPIVNWAMKLGLGISPATLHGISVVLITLILSYFTLVFGELVPKRLAMKRSEQLALGISGLISFISSAFKPIVWLLTVSTNGVLRLFGIDPNEVDEDVSEEEILMMVDAGSEKGAIDETEKELIENVFQFDDLTAGEISTHRTDIRALWLDEDMDKWAQTIHESRHTLYPVCDESPDDIVGILNAKDFFRMNAGGRDQILKEAVKPAFFVPETMKADVLFRNMRQTRNAMAVVLDEYGGVEGIVTFMDLVERLIGDVVEEASDLSADEPTIEKIGESLWKINGNIELDVIEETLGVSLGLDDVDTFTGLVFGALDMIPDDGEQNINLQFKDLQIHISRIEEHQVEKATIRLLPTQETAEK